MAKDITFEVSGRFVGLPKELKGTEITEFDKSFYKLVLIRCVPKLDWIFIDGQKSFQPIRVPSDWSCQNMLSYLRQQLNLAANTVLRIGISRDLYYDLQSTSYSDEIPVLKQFKQCDNNVEFYMINKIY